MRIALALGFCLLAFAAVAAPPATARQDGIVSQTREAFRARMNENVVTIMAGSPSGTDLAIVQDLAEVLDDGDSLRVLPLVGKGPEQNIKDVMFLRGVDMGVTQANLLKHFDKTGELGPNLKGQIAYIAKLFNEELHILARDDVKDIHELSGKFVNFGTVGSGAEITGRLIFDALGVEAKAVHLSDADAIQKLKAGEIDATIAVTGKPAPVLSTLRDTKGLKLLPVPYTKALEDEYYPATLTHEDYPELIAEGARVDTMSVCAVLVSFNWASDSERYKKISRFVDRFFTNFDSFLKEPHHPKWREVNFAATLEGWKRSALAQSWIDRAKASTDTAARDHFNAFLAQASGPRETPISEAERADLFRAFLEWNKGRNQPQSPNQN
ncbi:MAG TPA: TAXI family TRAP transporter solute-binding subunit [Methyloceanibacter sp.]|jgi:TRAP transporter TAXI family solute receptor|nr:TAXI family TRAP transporter solute-binding subunit [Methyloceanibacter sp.]